ncbi:MAG: hypothetical protein HQ562_02410 [Candidatus Marinimicrobia bacterium]|nr:hypothetical protein [Candidatus Neomarinimicrobiota bacterium]
MTENTTFTISQDYELICPQKKLAYPILVEEWAFLKEKIRNIKDSANFFHTIGSILFGVAGSSLLAFFTYDKPESVTLAYNTRIVITLAIFGVTAICGSFAFYFGRKERDNQNISSTEVISQMNLIEKRYEDVETQIPTLT